MPDWITEAAAVALISGAITLAGYLIQRMGRKEEIAATERDNLVKNLGAQLDRVTKNQEQDRKRIDWLEQELWDERAHSHKKHRALGETVGWGERMVLWADGDRQRDYPVPPDFPALRILIDEPRPRRPPPPADDPD